MCGSELGLFLMLERCGNLVWARELCLEAVGGWCVDRA